MDLVIGFSSGRMRSRNCASPPTIITSCPVRAPSTPPDTGASRNAAPASATLAAARCTVVTLIVEQSTTTLPGANAGCMASITASTSASADPPLIITSLRCASSAGSAACDTPCVRAKEAAFAAERFQTQVNRPALARFAAMPSPIAPRPINPTFIDSLPPEALLGTLGSILQIGIAPQTCLQLFQRLGLLGIAHRSRSYALLINIHQRSSIKIHIAQHRFHRIPAVQISELVTRIAQLDSHGIGVAKEIMHISQNFLVSAHHEHPQQIFLAIPIRRQGECRFDAFTVYIKLDRAIGIAS